MSRTNKKTRIRQLSPKLQLQERDTLTGSYPTNVRLASDNRSGKYNINYNDNNTIDFISYATGSVTSSVVSGSPSHLGTEYSPIALYNFDGDIEDTSGNNFHLKVITGTEQYTDGPFSGSQSLLLNGSTYLSSSVESILQITGSVTIQSFFKPARIQTFGNIARFYIAAIGAVKDDLTEGLTSNILYSLAINPNGTDGSVSGSTGFVLERAIGTNYVGEQTGSILVPDNWYHLAISRNNSNVSTVYLNGTDVGSFDHSSPTFPEKDSSGNIQRLYVGYKPYVGEITSDENVRYSGSISNLKIVAQEMSAEEILDEYQKVTTGSVTTTTTTTNVGLLSGIGFPFQSSWVQDKTALDLPNSGAISTPGPVRSVILEGQPFFHFTPGQDLTPFKENDNPVLDGLSVTSSFYKEGSPINLIGEGFNQPLWSKSKIQIQLPVGSSNNTIQTYVSGGRNTTVNTDPASGSVEKLSAGTASNGFGNVNLSYPMSYYNFVNQCWDGVGRGEAYDYLGLFANKAGSNKRAIFYETETIGFSQGLVNYPAATLNKDISGSFEYMAGAGHPISNFGFPFHAKYHATSSQTINMSNYINEPFMVEKIVVDFSGSFEFNSENYTTSSIVSSSISPDTVISSSFPAAINNFFILVQRKPYSFKKDARMYYYPFNFTKANDLYMYSELPTNVTLSNASGNTFVNTTRDILTYGGISSFAANTTNVDVHRSGSSLISDVTKNPKTLMTRDFALSSSNSASNNLNPLSWNGDIRLELGSYNLSKISDFFGEYSHGSNGGLSRIYLKNDFGGRNGLGITNPTGRDTNSPIVSLDSKANTQVSNIFINLIEPNDHKKYGGYILKPEDSLIFGWQQPIPLALQSDGDFVHVNDGILTKMTFGNAMVTIYGSLVREGKEYHDTLNQLLSSEAINEVIE